MEKSMEFKELGTNCCDCGFSLIGRRQTVGAEICSKIEHAFLMGTLAMDVLENTIVFVFEGITVSFPGKPERLSAIREMLRPENHLCIESHSDSNYKGFVLMAGN